MQAEYRGVEQLVARRAHNPEVVGSSPASATMLCNQKRYCTGKPRSRNGFWVFSYPEFQVQTKRYFSLLRGLELPTPVFRGGFWRIFSSESRLFPFSKEPLIKSLAERSCNLIRGSLENTIFIKIAFVFSSRMDYYRENRA